MAEAVVVLNPFDERFGGLTSSSKSSLNWNRRRAITQKGPAMGILDSLENSPAFKGALGQLEGAVLPIVLSEVLGNGSQGGLSAIVAKLQKAFTQAIADPDVAQKLKALAVIPGDVSVAVDWLT